VDGQVCNRALKVLSTRNARGEFFCPGPIAAMDGGQFNRLIGKGEKLRRNARPSAFSTALKILTT